ncbi:response regulator [Oleidesulfovibrio sp.]|uniref:response regulator n=1 Tax=Oleidesulfovibrio sp. TaxID=2909707 RepID=UPI003A8B79FD
MSILIIDDEPMIRMTLSAYLEDAGYDTHEASDGVEGLSILAVHQEKIQAIIVDLNMPRMDGYEFLQAAGNLLKRIPCIVLSGSGYDDEVEKAVKLGAAGFFLKPIPDLDELVSHLEHTLTSRRS